MSSTYEEHFAPESDNESVTSVESTEIPVKRYVIRTSDHDEVALKLKMENLALIKERVKKGEAEQVRYLSLDNATKDVEIQELKTQISRLETIVNLIQEFEEAISTTEENNLKYKTLLTDITRVNYRSMMTEEGKQITRVSLPSSEDGSEYPKVMIALEYMFVIQKKAEDSLRNKFHDAIFRSAPSSIPRCHEHTMGEFILGVVLCIVLLYIASH